MFKKLTFGQYAEKNSMIHRLDPRIKIISMVILSIAAFLMDSYARIAVFTLLTLVIISLSKMKYSSLIRNLRPFSLMFLFILMMYIIFSMDNLFFGILTIWKFALFIIIASILTFTTTITNMVTAIEKLLAPLKLVKINPKTVAILISLTIRFVPALFLYADRIRDARISRLGNLNSTKHVILFFNTLLEKILKSASTLSDAMVARNYTPKRTSYYNIIKLKMHDYVAFAILLISIFFILAV